MAVQRFEAELRRTGRTFSHRREYVERIEEAKRPETRARRIEKAVAMVREGQTQH